MSEVIRISLSGNISNKKIEELVEELKGGKDDMLAIKERIDAEFRGYRERGLKDGRREGLKDGRREGLKDGRKVGRQEIIKRLINKGYKVKEIASMTNLTEKEIKNILK